MKFYVQKNDDIVIAYGCSSELPDGVTEITEEEYKSGVAALAEADKKAQEEAEAKAKEDQEVAKKAAEERQAKIDDYVNKVKVGTLKIDDVPEDFRTAVNVAVNPPKTNAEKIDRLQKQIDVTVEALNIIMMSIAQ